MGKITVLLTNGNIGTVDCDYAWVCIGKIVGIHYFDCNGNFRSDSGEVQEILEID